MSIPEIMHAVELSEYSGENGDISQYLKPLTKPTPKPGPGQVLVRMEAAPVNPSDLSFVQGTYNVKKTLPAVPGFEGSGTVVAAGPGLLGKFMKGKRVAAATQADRDGTWAEYYIAEAKTCIPLKKGVDFIQGACIVVNPLTAAALLDEAKRKGAKAVIQNAAASQLGRMLVALAAQEKIPLINIVRRPEQVELLKKHGAAYIINSGARDFEDVLTRVAADLGATVALDPVAGDMSGTILNAMPPESQLIVYGNLAGKPIGNLSTRHITGGGKTLRGFHLSRWVKERGLLTVMRTSSLLQKYIAAGIVQTEIQKEMPLDQAAAGIKLYTQNMTAGKVIFRPPGKENK